MERQQRERPLVERIKRDVLFGRDITPPSVDLEKCTGCGTCVMVCPSLVLALEDGHAQVVRGWGCIACGHCSAVCPEEAVIQAEPAIDPAALGKDGRSPVGPAELQRLIRQRRSVRLFGDERVTHEQLAQLIEAARYVPTGTNRQAVSYTVLGDPEKVGRLRSVLEAFMERMSRALENPVTRRLLEARLGRQQVQLLRHHAGGYRHYRDMSVADRARIAYYPLPYGPAVIIAHSERFDPSAQFGCAEALYACTLMAESMGLAGCFLGFVPAAVNGSPEARAWLGIPRGSDVFGALVLGHPRVTYRRLVDRQPPNVNWV